MTRAVTSILLCWAFLLSAAAAGPIKITPVSSDEAQAWVRHVMPLPKKIEVRSKVSIRPSDVVVSHEQDALVMQAAEELRQSLRIGSSASSLARPAFHLKLSLGGPDAEPLRELKNSDQAYRIIPGANNKGLKLVALTPTGLLYASKTLRQMIEAYSAESLAVVPIADITDWPDLEYRGLWGADNTDHLEWLSGMKMNFQEPEVLSSQQVPPAIHQYAAPFVEQTLGRGGGWQPGKLLFTLGICTHPASLLRIFRGLLCVQLIDLRPQRSQPQSSECDHAQPANGTTCVSRERQRDRQNGPSQQQHNCKE